MLPYDAVRINANVSKIFTMRFQFDKAMDRDSIENITNWKIGRTVGNGPGQAYNYGMSISSTEVSLAPLKIQQNASADGTIDPCHIEFKFSGEDIYGSSMDLDHDQFTGFSGTV